MVAKKTRKAASPERSNALAAITIRPRLLMHAKQRFGHVASLARKTNNCRGAAAMKEIWIFASDLGGNPLKGRP